MADSTVDLDLLHTECRRRAASYLSGRSDRFDLLAMIAGIGVERPDEVSEEGDAPPLVRQLARAGAALTRGTASLAAASVQAREGHLPLAAAWLELERTADPDRIGAIASAIHTATQEALQSPMDEAFAAVQEPVEGEITVPEILTPKRLFDLLGEFTAAGRPPHRLVATRRVLAPVPIDGWRTELRPLIQGLLDPVDATLGIAAQRAAHGPAAFAAYNPSRAGRLTVFARPGTAMAIARSFALATGAAVAVGVNRTDLVTPLSALFAGRLASPSLWRGVGLSRSDAAAAALHAGQSLLRMVARLSAFVSCGEDDARAMAAAAAALMRERDDVAAALRWRGPWPNPLGLPVPCGRPALRDHLLGLARGLAAEQVLSGEVGEEWHRTPEAAERLLETVEAVSADTPEPDLERLL